MEVNVHDEHITIMQVVISENHDVQRELIVQHERIVVVIVVTNQQIHIIQVTHVVMLVVGHVVHITIGIQQVLHVR